jgi:hypothetical protein
MTDLTLGIDDFDRLAASCALAGATPEQQIPLYHDYDSFKAWAFKGLMEAAQAFKSATDDNGRKLATKRYDKLIDIPINKQGVYREWLQAKINQVVPEPCQELAHWILTNQQAVVIDSNAYRNNKNHERGGWKGVWWENGEGKLIFSSIITSQSYVKNGSDLALAPAPLIKGEVLAPICYLKDLHQRTALSSKFPELADFLVFVSECRRIVASNAIVDPITDAARPKSQAQSARARPAPPK